METKRRRFGNSKHMSSIAVRQLRPSNVQRDRQHSIIGYFEGADVTVT
jgi:hypothetical protein